MPTDTPADTAADKATDPASFKPSQTWAVFNPELLWADDLKLIIHRSGVEDDIRAEVERAAEEAELVAYHRGIDNSAQTTASITAVGYTIIKTRRGLDSIAWRWYSLRENSFARRHPATYDLYENRGVVQPREAAETDLHRVVHDHIVLPVGHAPYKHLTYICPDSRLEWIFDILDPSRLRAREGVRLDADSYSFAWQWLLDGSELARTADVELTARLAEARGVRDFAELEESVTAIIDEAGGGMNSHTEDESDGRRRQVDR